MKNQFSFFDLLIIFGIIQGVITSILLFISKKNKNSNKFLALTLLSFCLLSTKTLLHTLHLWDTHIFRFFPNGIELALPPLIYFYVLAVIKPSFKFKQSYWLHFIPFFIAQIFAFIVYFKTQQTFDFNEKDSIAKSFLFTDVKQIEEYLLMISLTIYMFYGYKNIIVYKKWLNETTSDSINPDFNWLITIFRIFIIIGFLKFINHFFDIFYDYKEISTQMWDFLMIVIAGLMYYLGLKGLLQPEYSFSREELFNENEAPSNLQDSKIKDTMNELQKAMSEDKIFLDPKLTIHELSKFINTSNRYLSFIINNQFETSFRNFINNYRVEEVKLKLIDPNFKHMSILGIALECGFNSEASFYRIFKKHTSLSPKEFILKSNS